MLPQVEEVFEQFPKIQTRTVDIAAQPELAGELSIFTAPVLLLFDHGAELVREARFVHMDEFERKIERIYRSYFE
ncbi:thioredoxin family protein [Planococcus massiliensis]|uniref:thioredoxin family protein n=1 Tax=Planococcus massiliensis TaxID=1499687 RepID=UPI002D21ABD2|nr:thioredoxin family protein [Planococcus massiliensis]